MASRSNNNYFYRRSEMGRSFLETVFSLPGRCWRTSRLKDMTKEEKTFAHFSKEVYAKPEDCRTPLRGYTLLKGSIPGHKKPVPLNDKRRAVYRAPNGLDHVLVFRGTTDLEDVGHDWNLRQGFGGHKYMVEAAVWSSRVMLFLNYKRRRRNNERLLLVLMLVLMLELKLVLVLVFLLVLIHGARLRFRVTGHSLGGAVALSVILHFHDIPGATKYLADDARAHNRPSDISITYKQEIADPWHDAISKTGTQRPYELSGGHVFNPGAWPRGRIFPRDFVAFMAVGAGTGALADAHAFGSAALAEFLTVGTGVGMVTAAVVSSVAGVGVLVGGSIFLRHLYNRTHGGSDSRPDRGVTTHHIIGDVLSCCYRMGKEKSYLPKGFDTHSISNFL